MSNYHQLVLLYSLVSVYLINIVPLAIVILNFGPEFVFSAQCFRLSNDHQLEQRYFTIFMPQNNSYSDLQDILAETSLSVLCLSIQCFPI